MNLQRDVDLRKYTTMRLGGRARYFAEVGSDEQLVELIKWAKDQQLPIMMIGGGSNIVWRDEGYEGLLLVNSYKLRDEKINSDGQTVELTFGAGENWDAAVEWSIGRGWSGLENLSLIPGLVGATPIQNVGAYGAEIADTLVELRAYDRQSEGFVVLKSADCRFSYRSSRLKTTDKGRFLITSITVKLAKKQPTGPFYEALQAYLDKEGITEYSPINIRKAVIAIRSSKLPDPAKVANNGSFFVNPIVSKQQFSSIKLKHPEVVGWHQDDGMVKLAAGKLLELAEFRGIHDQATGMATWPAQSLVLVNEHAHHTSDLLTFKQKIIDKIEEMFGVTLVQEPELLP